MNTQQKKLLAIAAVVFFHGAVITVMLAQHGCKSDGSKPSSAEAPAQLTPVAPIPVTANSLTSSSNGFVEPTHPAPETPVTPVPVAQFAESLPSAAPNPGASSTSMTITYVVSSGESLASIARKNKISVDALVAANAPKVTRTTILHPGQSLNIPNSAPAAATPAAVAADGGNTYKVVSGDSLSRIAAKYHTTSKALQELNGLTSATIRAGQVLKVPATGAASTSSSPDASVTAVTPASSSDTNTYTIKAGDSLDKIARTLHVSASELMSLNGLTDATAHSLRPGHTLKVPSGASGSAATPPTSAPTSVTALPASSAPPPVTMPVTAVPDSGSGAPPLTPVN